MPDYLHLLIHQTFMWGLVLKISLVKCVCMSTESKLLISIGDMHIKIRMERNLLRVQCMCSVILEQREVMQDT